MSNRVAFIFCALLVLTFGVLAHASARRHSPTIDEPICALAGYLHVHERDFRFDADNPPLWKFIAMIANLGVTLRPASAHGGGGSGGEGFVAATRRLFQTPGNDGDSFINRGRDMMLLLGMALGAVIAAWAWRAAGITAALTSCLLFAFDPNFLAHAPLFKADVAVALLVFSMALATWSVGRRARAGNIAALCLLCGAAATVKYNALIAPVLAMGLLSARALLPAAWPAFGRAVSSRRGRCSLVLVIALAAVTITVASIWACYGFRHEPSRIPGATLDIRRLIGQADEATLTSAATSGATARAPAPAPVDAAPAPLIARAAMLLDRNHLLPQAWLYGLVSIYHSSTAISRQSYLMDQISANGWWYYFPVAMLAKTPMATIAALLLAAMVLLIVRPHAGKRDQDDQSSGRDVRNASRPAVIDRWTIACLAIPPIVYALAATAGSANVGIRHVLPLYPPLFVAVGIAAARLAIVRWRAFVIGASALGVGLLLESLAAFPHELSFFNPIARPHRLYLLSDSNLDWGQDLKYIAAWQREHPDVRLYLGYWGTVDPAFYGIRYTNIPGGFATSDDAPPMMLSPGNPPGVLMIGATLLQGVNFPPAVRSYYAVLRDLPPSQIIGDATYLYEWPPRAGDAP